MMYGTKLAFPRAVATSNVLSGYRISEIFQFDGEIFADNELNSCFLKLPTAHTPEYVKDVTKLLNTVLPASGMVIGFSDKTSAHDVYI